MLDGIWVAASATLGGEPVPQHVVDAIRLELFGGTYAVNLDRGRYEIDLTQEPAAMDLIDLEGPNAGRTLRAIFDEDGDTLVLCYDVSGAERPEQFCSTPGTLELLISFTRAALA